MGELRREVPVGKPSRPEGGPPSDVDADGDRRDVRLQPDRSLDGAGEAGGGRARDGYPEILVEDPPEFDAGLEQERLPVTQVGAVDRASGHLVHPGGVAVRGTVNGPTR
jgi:hypothetical protein